MKPINIAIPNYATETDGLLYVRTHDEHYIHQSFLLESGHILVFESIPVNYPSNGLCVFETIDAYLASVKDVPWLNDTDYIVYHQLEAHGFPFVEE